MASVLSLSMGVVWLVGAMVEVVVVILRMATVVALMGCSPGQSQQQGHEHTARFTPHL